MGAACEHALFVRHGGFTPMWRAYQHSVSAGIKMTPARSPRIDMAIENR